MAEIKSALEIALEKAERLGRVDKEELKEQTYLDEGRRLAAKYLREEDVQINTLLDAVPVSVRPLVRKGAEETLLRNIILPRDDDAEKNVRKALKGFLKMKKNNPRVQKLTGQLEELFRAYRKTVKDTRQQLKARFGARMDDLQRQLGQELSGKNLDIESQPQFQEQWLQVSTEINDHFNGLLEQQKKMLATL